MKNNKIITTSFRINRGIFKGSKLFLEKNHNTRPSKALVKKSFFDSMQSNIEDKIFIECFAGSGQIGFEAASLNASRIIFFEKDSKAFMNLSKNIQIMQEKFQKAKEFGQEFKCKDILAYNMDFFNSIEILENILESPKEKKSDTNIKHAIITEDFFHCNDKKIILYLDPPFNIRSGFTDIYHRLQNFIENLNKSLVDRIDSIIIESISNFEFANVFKDFSLYKSSKFGKTTLKYFERH